ncbi:MAG: hypothetical protein OER88_11735, partial [Planctomycetota bacterium]|nr:hypothetical protein [Planctomycetota bacterium]
GVVHRDLKPANIMVGNFGEVYVMDWGLAKVLGGRAEPADLKTPAPDRSLVQTVRSAESTDAAGDSATATGAGQILGTPAYMPLEQAMGLELDARSDIYAVGSMLYELLVGKHPYADKGRSAHEVLVALVAGEPTPIRKLNARVPGEVTAICEKAMARGPADRYQTAGELAQELRNFIEGRVVRTYRTGAFVELKKWVTRNKALASAIGAAFILLVVGVVMNRSLYQDAVHESERAQREAYRAAVSAAAAQIENHDYRAAEARLDALPPRLRGWEWRHLKSRVEPSYARIPMRALAFDARDGRVLGTRPDAGLLAYDLETDSTTEIVARDVVGTPARFLSSDGRFCVVRLEDGGLGVRDLHTSRIVLRKGGSLHPVHPWLHDGKRFVDLATGREARWDDAAARLAVQARSKEQVWPLISPDRKRIALIRDNIVKFLDVATGRPIGETLVVGGEAKATTWSPDGTRLAACGLTRRITVIDAHTATVEQTMIARDGWVVNAAFSADGRMLLTSTPAGSQVWDLRDRAAKPFVLRGHASYVYPVAFSPDGTRIASGGWDGHVGQIGALRLWDAATGRQVTKTIRDKMVLWTSFPPDGRSLLCSSPRGLQLLDADTLDVLRTLAPASHHAALNPDGTRVAVPHGIQIRVIDTATGNLLAELPADARGAVAFGSRWIGTAGRGKELILWNAETYEREAVIGTPVSAVAFESDGTRILTTDGDGVARVFDGVTKRQLAELPGHGRQILCVRFSPDGRRILVGGRDRHIHVWDADTYDEIVQLRGHENYVYSMDFSPDGETLVTGSGDGTVRLWGTQSVAVRQRAIAKRQKLAS